MLTPRCCKGCTNRNQGTCNCVLPSYCNEYVEDDSLTTDHVGEYGKNLSIKIMSLFYDEEEKFIMEQIIQDMKENPTKYNNAKLTLIKREDVVKILKKGQKFDILKKTIEKKDYKIKELKQQLAEKDHRIAVLERALELAIFYMDCVCCPLKSMNCETTCSDTKVYDYLIEMVEKGLEGKDVKN